MSEEVKVRSLFYNISKTIREQATKQSKSKKEFFPIRKRRMDKFKKETISRIPFKDDIYLVVGTLKSVDEMGIQAILFDLNKWDKSDAKRWFKNNKDVLKTLMDKKELKDK